MQFQKNSVIIPDVAEQHLRKSGRGLTQFF